jgi:hypothetical protein
MVDVFTHYHADTDFSGVMRPASGGAPIRMGNVSSGATGTSARRAPDLGPTAQKPAPSRTTNAASDGQSCLSYSTDMALSVDPTLSADGHFSSDIQTWGWARIPHAATVALDTQITMGAAFDLEIRKALQCQFGLDDYSINVVTVPIPMSILYSAGVTFAAEGKVKVENLGYQATLGLSGNATIGTSNHGGGDLAVDGHLVNPTGSGAVNLSASLGGDFTFGPGQGTKKIGAIAGIGGTVDFAKISVGGTFNDPETNAPQCLKLGFGGEAKLRLHAEAWVGSLQGSGSFDLLSRPWNWVEPYYWPASCDVPLGTGQVQATLSWANNDDMDLHVIDPSGEEIFYGHDASESGGVLDRDVIPGCEASEIGNGNVENIFWPADGAPSGTYRVFVNEYHNCSDTNGQWTLQVRVNGQRVLSESGTSTSQEFTFEVP